MPKPWNNQYILVGASMAAGLIISKAVDYMFYPRRHSEYLIDIQKLKKSKKKFKAMVGNLENRINFVEET